MRPNKLRFCIVLVVWSGGVEIGVGDGEDRAAWAGVGDSPNRLSWARTAAAAKSRK